MVVGQRLPLLDELGFATQAVGDVQEEAGGVTQVRVGLAEQVERGREVAPAGGQP